jgi:hypothetical protein
VYASLDRGERQRDVSQPSVSECAPPKKLSDDSQILGRTYCIAGP